MRLINVNAILDVERSIGEGKEPDPATEVLVELRDVDLVETKYVILSHCWGAPQHEVQFKEMRKFTTINKYKRNAIRKRTGYKKIIDACKQARNHNLDWLWIDTCCVNKDSVSEPSQAINSYRWLENSEQCYAYLHDVHDNVVPAESNKDKFPNSNGWPRWFSRIWTLQELVVPKSVHFFDHQWKYIGNKKSLSVTLEHMTRIPKTILTDGLSAERSSVAQIMCWAAGRRTSQFEDRAYSLLGLLGVYMSLLYGEGKHAFRRLQEEVIRRHNDYTIFTWSCSRKTGWSSSFLAGDPSGFMHCSDIVEMGPTEFKQALKEDFPEDELLQLNFSDKLRSFTITNNGIRMWLPIKPCRGSAWLFEATLPCRRLHDSKPITIIIARFDSHCFRYFGDCKTSYRGKAQLEPIFLPYKDEDRDSEFRFDIHTLSYDGFIQHPVFPDDIQVEDKSVILSSNSDCAVIVYEHTTNKTCFAIVLYHCFGKRQAIHVTCDESSGGSRGYAEQIYQTMRKDGLMHTYHIADAQRTTTPIHYQGRVYLTKHAHFPRSICGVRVTCEPFSPSQSRCTVMVEISQCNGCCMPIWREIYCPTGDLDKGKESTTATHPHVNIPDSVPSSPYIVMVAPRVGYQEKADEATRAWFGEIIHQFDTLLNSTEIEKESSISFFVKMFGSGHFNDFIGDIVFFRILPSIAKGKVNDQEKGTLGEEPNVVQDLRVKVLARNLIEDMLSDMDGTNSMFSHWLSKAADIRHKADNLRMRSFGPELLRAISIAYKQSLQIYCGRQSKIKRNNIWNIKDRDRIRSAIEKVEMYQAKLRMVTDGDEQRTLQEDITGKVLQACWYGVRAEVETLLAKVMDNIVNDKEVSAGMRWARAERLKNIGMIMEDVIEGAPDNGNCPLRRITADAEAEVSKHDLFLEQKARTAEAAVEGQPTNNTNPS